MCFDNDKMANISGLIIFIFYAAFSRICHGELQCYMGTSKYPQDVNITNCVEKHEHNMSLTGLHGNISSFVYNHSLHEPGSQDTEFIPVTHCLSFTKTSPDSSTEFICDMDHLCDNVTSKDGTKSNMKLKGSIGTLHCCSGNLCNNPNATLPHPPSKLTCFVGTSSTSTPGYPLAKSCNVTGVPQCMNATYFDKNGGISNQVYQCEKGDFCTKPSNMDACHNRTNADGILYTTCCCSTPNCNLEASISNKSSSVPRMPGNPNYSSNQAHSHWVFIGGIVAAAMLAILVFIVVAIVIRKYRQHKAEQLSYTYTQLTADLAESDATETETLTASSPDDENMIIG